MRNKELVRRVRAAAFALTHPPLSSFERLRRAGVVTMGVGSYEAGAQVFDYSADSPARLRIGNYCSIAYGATFLLAAGHHPDWATTSPLRGATNGQPTFGDITLGHDVWVGHGAIVLEGVTIGDGAIIAAGAVVTSDVRPYSIVGGVPAREIRRRFDDQTVAALLDARWWDLPEDVVRDHAEVFCSSNVADVLVIARNHH